MNYEGNAPEYTAFALVAIESVWPNPTGGELAADEYDLSLLGMDAQTVNSNSKVSTSRGTYSPTLKDYTDVTEERDYYRTQGYYKLIPLNVVAVKTSASTQGNSFQVTFTLDDLMMVTSKKTEALIDATGLPMNRMDLTESGLPGRLPTLREPLDGGPAEWHYVKDEDLGLARYRITGASTSFNIEDLVEANDTITIWLYHDPKDFYFKDGNIQVNPNTIQFDDGIKSVVGSANRMNQFSSNSPSFSETLLGIVGLVNQYVGQDIQNAINGNKTTSKPKVNKSNVYNILNDFVVQAESGINKTNVPAKVKKFTEMAFPNLYPDQIYSNLISYHTGFYIESTTTSGVGYNQQINNIRDSIRQLINVLPTSNKLPGLYTDLTKIQFSGKIQTLFKDIGINNINSANDFIGALRSFIIGMNQQIDTYISEYKKRREISVTQQNFSNGRKMLLNGSHGETPYLAFKGQISDVNVSTGTVSGTHLVTLTGTGYEKILNTTEVYFEDLMYPGKINLALADYNTVYVYMSPPRAILSMISEWASKRVILGKATSYSGLAFDRFLSLARPLNKTTIQAKDSSVKFNTSEKFLGGLIPLRGDFVYSAFDKNLLDSHVRLFNPVNYIDTTRIQEMIRVLDSSYDKPEVQAAINTAVTLDGRNSVYSNLRKVGGVAEFYELFMDETGRLRYRLSLEAWGRISHPEYTPIIQDIDVLGNGATFGTSDKQVKTMVDVTPILGQSVFGYMGLAFIGRSVPQPGKIPMNVEETIPDSSIAPEMFRYGLRSLKIDDIYTSETGGAQRKAIIYREYYGRPIKHASIKIRNNTSYRVGETVLVSLQNTKHRARSLIDIPKMLNWFKYLKNHTELIPSYIGIDPRLTHTDYYTQTQAYNPIPDKDLQEAYNSDPYAFVLDQFIATFEFLQNTLPGINVLTPEFFPSTYWFYTHDTGKFFAWDELNIDDATIRDLYLNLLQGVVLNNESAKKVASNIFQSYEGIINSLKFQDFRAIQYYIESVSHNFQQDSEATTTLELNFGQDMLVLLEPKRNLPIGFLSLHSPMRIGYDSPTQNKLWFTPPGNTSNNVSGTTALSQTTEASRYSPIQNMFLNQYKEDLDFKKASFMYNAQVFRNTSNYMYELALREGINNYEITTPIDAGGGETVQATYHPPAGVSPYNSGATDSRALAMKVAKQVGVTDESLITEAANKYSISGTSSLSEVEAQMKAFYIGAMKK